MQPNPSLEREWQEYCESLYPGGDAASVAELRRTFFAGALVLEMLMLRVASEEGLLPVPEGRAQRFLEALAPLRKELHRVAEELADEPNDGA